MEESNDKNSFEKLEKYYLNGKYAKYKASVGKIVDVGLTATNVSTQSLILRNNLLVTECLELKWNEDTSSKIWAELLLQFSTLFHQCSDLELKIMPLEFQLWLNVLHNYLFLMWIFPNEITDKKTQYAEMTILVINGFKFILDYFNKQSLSLENLAKEIHVLNLMKMSCTHEILFSTEGSRNIGIQLLEMYFLTTQIVIESVGSNNEHLVNDMLKCYADFLETVNNFKASFEMCKDQDQNKSCSSDYASLFKFGLHKANSKVGDYDIDTIFCALSVTHSFCFLKMKKFKSGLMVLPNTFGSSARTFIINYLKSYIYFKLHDFEASYHFIRKTSGLNLDGVVRARRALLNGVNLLKRDQFLKAENEFRMVQEIDSFLPLALYYSAVNYQTYALSQHHGEQVPMNVRSQSDQQKRLRMNLSTTELPIVAFKALILSLRNINKRDCRSIYDFTSLECRLLSILHPQPEITESHAIYLLVKELVSAKKFSESADKLLYLQTVPQHCHSQCSGLIESPPVPELKILMHETVTVLIQDKRWIDAEIVCKQCLSTCNNRGESLIPHMLLAQIEKQKGLEDDALGILNRCLNLVNCWEASEKMQGEDVKDMKNKLAAKACVQIGHIYIERHLQRVAEKHFKRALCYNKKDKDALYHLIMLLKNNVTASHVLWDEHHKIFKDNDVQYTNIALNYLLQTQVTKEQVEILSVDFLVGDPVFLDDFEEVDDE